MALATIKLKRGTAAEWAAANPTLSAGEPGLETDTGNMKLGDGVTAYNSLLARVPTPHKTTRSATSTIAASDSSEKSRAQANYVCDGTNDNVEIQAAIDELPDNGGSICLLEGLFSLDAPNSYYINNSLYSLHMNKNNLDFYGCKGTKLQLKNGIVVNNGAANSYLATIFMDADNVSVHDIHFDNNNANVTADYNLSIWHGVTEGINHYIDISKNYFENNHRWAIWGDGGGKYWNVHHNMVVPGTEGGIAFHNAPSDSIISNNIIGNYESPIGTGIFLDSMSNVAVCDNVIKSPTAFGIEAYDEVKNCLISGNIIDGHGVSANPIGISLLTKGTEISANVNNIIQNNSFYDITYGIVVDDIYSQNTIIKDNTFNTVPHPVTNRGTGTIIKYNEGYVTENVGTATITAGQTSVTVPHGLASTPTRVQLTPSTNTTGKYYWVSAKAANSFIISIDSAAASGISFDWSAVV